jgi:hypothetical protein
MRYTSDIPRDSLLSLLAAPAMEIEDIFHDTRRAAHWRGRVGKINERMSA